MDIITFNCQQVCHFFVVSDTYFVYSVNTFDRKSNPRITDTKIRLHINYIIKPVVAEGHKYVIVTRRWWVRLPIGGKYYYLDIFIS